MNRLVLATLLLAGSAPAGEARNGQVLLGPGGHLRCWSVMGKPFTSNGKSNGRTATGTASPPGNWQKAEFDDSSWTRMRVRRMADDHSWTGAVSSRGHPSLALQCVRGRFRVTDPAAAGGLRLSVVYRGGAVVYVNGVEVGRGHLPAGKMRPDALAADYPTEAYFYAPGQPLPQGGPKAKKYSKNLRRRLRRIEDLAIPAKVLRKGVNVLAVEIHCSAYNAKALAVRRKRSPWDTCGLVELDLRGGSGVSPNTARPKGVQVWAASTVEELGAHSYADPCEPVRPIRITGVRNGSFTGQAVVSSDGEIPGVKAALSDLKRVGGEESIPAKAVRVLFPRMSRPNRWERSGLFKRSALYEAAPGKVAPVGKLGAVQPVWIKVKVPTDAVPGEYRGTLSVTAGGRKHDVPVHLRVIGWKLPAPREWAVHMGAIQSPESVALKYKVPMWSEKHWRLLEESFKLLGEIGNNYAVVPLLARTNLGNSESMVRWIRDGDGYRHDFSIVERYLDLAMKYCRLDAVTLYGWEGYLGGSGRYGNNRKGKGAMVTLLDPKTGKTELIAGPIMHGPDYNEAAARKFWEPVYKGLYAIAKKRGIEKKLVWGMVGDGTPGKDGVKLMHSILPDVPWSAHGHHDRVGNEFHGVPIAYGTAAYGNRKRHPPGGKTICAQFPRYTGMFANNLNASPLSRYRHVVEWLLGSGRNGLGRIGADFWEGMRKKTAGGYRSGTSISTRYPESDWNQLNINNALLAFLGAGPEGAIPTIRFELLREGQQEVEARVFIERALAGGGLPADLAAKCRKVLAARARTFGYGRTGVDWSWLAGDFVSVDMAEELFSCAAGVAGK